MLESAILVAGGISFIAVRLAVKSVYVALGFNSASVHLIENQVRSGSEQAEQLRQADRQGIWAQESGKP